MSGGPLGVSRSRGPWGAAEVESYLRHTVIPARLAAVAPSGWPIVLSLWYLLDGETIVCATQRSSGIVRALEHDPRCAFEIAGERPPYRGVRGRGTVEIAPEGAVETLTALIERYLGSTGTPLARWLLARADDEVCIRITPTELSTWDYTERMSGEPA